MLAGTQTGTNPPQSNSNGSHLWQVNSYITLGYHNITLEYHNGRGNGTLILQAGYTFDAMQASLI